MVSSEIRANARESLTKKWGIAALLTLVYILISYLVILVCSIIPIIGGIASAVLTVPFSYGFIVSLIKLKRNEEVGYVDFVSTAFSSFTKIWGVTLNVCLKMIVPIVLYVVFYILVMVGTAGSFASYVYDASNSAAGFSVIGTIGSIGVLASSIYLTIKGLLYSLTNFILFDNPEMPSKEIVERSASLMNGHRGNFFILTLTFIGWAFLSVFSFGIGFLFLMPYIMISQVIFYEDRAGLIDDPNPGNLIQ